MLTAVDELEVHIVVDNTTDSLSSTPSHVEKEFSYHRRKGVRVLTGRCLCCGLHLSGATENLIPDTVQALKKFGSRRSRPATAPAGAPWRP